MAKEYIDRVGLIAELDCRVEDLRTLYGNYDHYTDGYDDCSEVVSNYPIAADVVEVVRCKDCKFLHPAAAANRFYCDWHREAFETSLDAFCSYGERREQT